MWTRALILLSLLPLVPGCISYHIVHVGEGTDMVPDTSVARSIVGEEVSIVRRNTSTLEGNVIESRADTLFIRQEDSVHVVVLTDIAKIRAGGSEAGAAFGGMTGTAAGLAIGTMGKQGMGAIEGFLLGTLLGATLGTVVGQELSAGTEYLFASSMASQLTSSDAAARQPGTFAGRGQGTPRCLPVDTSRHTRSPACALQER